MVALCESVDVVMLPSRGVDVMRMRTSEGMGRKQGEAVDEQQD